MTLGRTGSKVKLKEREWERMIAVLSENGWQIDVPAEMLLVHDARISEESATSLAAAVKKVEEKDLKEVDIGADQWSKVGTLAGEGPFSVWIAIKSPGGD